MNSSTTLTLRPSKWPSIVLLFVCLAFLAITLYFLLNRDQPLNWLGVIFFGAGVGIALFGMLPGSAYLELTPTGFKIRSLLRSQTYRWRDVDSFRTADVLYVGRFVRRMVVFDIASPYQQSRSLRRVSKALTGYDVALPDLYGVRADDLAALMNEWRERYT